MIGIMICGVGGRLRALPVTQSATEQPNAQFTPSNGAQRRTIILAKLRGSDTMRMQVANQFRATLFMSTPSFKVKIGSN